MELLPVLLHLMVIHLVMAMVPGPNTVVISYCSAGMSRRAGLIAAAGVTVASLIWVTFSLAGMSALLMQMGSLFRLMRLAGAAYLIYVGIRLLFTRAQPQAAEARPVYRSPFLAGFLTTLSNPKSAIFWTSVFVLVVPPHAPAWFYALIPALITLQAFIWYGTVALVLSTPFNRRHYARLSTVLNRIAGGCMLFFGLRIANEIRAEVAARAL